MVASARRCCWVDLPAAAGLPVDVALPAAVGLPMDAGRRLFQMVARFPPDLGWVHPVRSYRVGPRPAQEVVHYVPDCDDEGCLFPRGNDESLHGDVAADVPHCGRHGGARECRVSSQPTSAWTPLCVVGVSLRVQSHGLNGLGLRGGYDGDGGIRLE